MDTSVAHYLLGEFEDTISCTKKMQKQFINTYKRWESEGLATNQMTDSLQLYNY